MRSNYLITRQLSHRPGSRTGIAQIPALAKRCGVFFPLAAVLALSPPVTASEKYSATEWLQENVQNAMAPAEILGLLNDTLGADAASGVNPTAHRLREGLYVTAIPERSNIILRLSVDRDNTKQRYTIAEVAISAKIGRQFFEFVQAALASAESVPLTDAQPWKLALTAESESGGQLTVSVDGDATAHFTVLWNFSSPKRPIDNFVIPTAFGSKKAGTEHIGAVVHFPITLQEFQFLTNIYGVGQRYHDFPLYPHTWLHLTVTNGPTDKYVIVHFDAITTNGQRVFVAQAPASIDVGGRFLNETVTRMKEMLNAEAMKAGSSQDWETSFPYEDSEYGLVAAVVSGHHGLFEVAYNLQTATQYVQPDEYDQ